MWKYKRETQEKAFQSRNITKKAVGKIECKHFIHKLKKENFTMRKLFKPETSPKNYLKKWEFRKKFKKEENRTKRNPVTCCFPIQPKRDPGDDDQKDTRAVHLWLYIMNNNHLFTKPMWYPIWYINIWRPERYRGRTVHLWLYIISRSPLIWYICVFFLKKLIFRQRGASESVFFPPDISHRWY